MHLGQRRHQATGPAPVSQNASRCPRCQPSFARNAGRRRRRCAERTARGLRPPFRARSETPRPSSALMHVREGMQVFADWRESDRAWLLNAWSGHAPAWPLSSATVEPMTSRSVRSTGQPAYSRIARIRQSGPALFLVALTEATLRLQTGRERSHELAPRSATVDFRSASRTRSDTTRPGITGGNRPKRQRGLAESQQAPARSYVCSAGKAGVSSRRSTSLSKIVQLDTHDIGRPRACSAYESDSAGVLAGGTG